MTDTNKKIDVGIYEIFKATLENPYTKKKAQIGQLITDITIRESILNSYLSADLTIFDTSGIIDEFPIIGEEIFTLTYGDYFGKKMTHVFHVYSVDQVKADTKSESQSFVLHLISMEFFKSESCVIRKFMAGALSNIVNDIFENYVGEKIDCDESDAEQEIIIPALTPFETVNFLLKKSYSSVYNSSAFFFYQNRKGFFYRVYESLIEKQLGLINERKIFTYGEPRLDIVEKKRSMNDIININFLTRFNTVNELRSGAMISNVLKLDIATKSFEENTYKHFENEDKYIHTDKRFKKNHTDSFINEYLSDNNVVNTFMTFEDSNMKNLKYSEILPMRNSSLFYLNKLCADIEIFGANDIFAGDLINLNIKEMKYVNNEKKYHPNLSGNYLVESIEHRMIDRNWIMKVRLLKDAFVNDR